MIKPTTLLTLTATTAALLLSLHAPALAQEQAKEETQQETTVVTATPNGVVSVTTQQGPGQPPGAFPAVPPGAFRMGQFMMGGRQGGMMGLELIDPSHSNVTLLLKRKDVYSELSMSSKQREALDALETKSRDEIGQTLQKSMQEMRAQMQQRGGGQPQTREERMAQMQARGQQMMLTMNTAMDEIEKKSEALLTPGQRRRVHELDLQWRGPLALSETSVADQLDLTPEQRGEVAKLLQDYQQAQGKAMMNLFQGFRPQTDPNAANGTTGRNGRGNRNGRNGGNGQNGNGGQNNTNGQNAQPGGFAFFQQPTTPEEQRERQAKLDATKAEVEKSRKENGDKVLALLTPEQKMTWTKLQGRKFTFRTVMN